MNLSNWGRQGSKAPASKLTEAKVVQIKTLLRDGMTCEAVSKQFRVTATTIQRIKRGETWTHVRL